MTPKPQWEIEFDEMVIPDYVNRFRLEIDIERLAIPLAIGDIRQFIRSQIETSYQQGVEDMRRKCVEILDDLIIDRFGMGSGDEDIDQEVLKHDDKIMEITNLIKNVK